MAAPDLSAAVAAIQAEVARTRGVHDSAIVLINSIPARLQVAVEAAIAADDAADEGTLQAVRDAFASETAALNASASALADAVAANPLPTDPQPAPEARRR